MNHSPLHWLTSGISQWDPDICHKIFWKTSQGSVALWQKSINQAHNVHVQVFLYQELNSGSWQELVWVFQTRSRVAFQHYPGYECCPSHIGQGIQSYSQYVLIVAFLHIPLHRNTVKCQLEGSDEKTQVRPTDMILYCIFDVLTMFSQNLMVWVGRAAWFCLK